MMKDNIVELLTLYLKTRDTLTEDEKRIILRSLEMVNTQLEHDDK